MRNIEYLQTRGAFAIACKVGIEFIEVGLLCLNGQQAAKAELLDPSTGDRYPVELPALKGADYNVKLPIRNVTI